LVRIVKRPVYITTSWDDGHPLDLRLAELLHKYDLPATFYIPLDNTLPLLTPSQVRELSAEFEVGAHTVHHCDLMTVPDTVTRSEITDCKSALEQITGRPCTAFCFPKGHFRRNHVRQVREAGYRMARTVELMSLEMPRVHDGLAMMPTTVQAGPAGFSRVTRNSLKRLRPMNLLRHVRYSQPDWVATAASVLEHVLKRGGVFHFWGHSWEVDQMGQWQNLERVFAILAQSKGHAVFTNNSGLTEATRP
jgi:peptidoglycan/xylan/chitin deacetylase (PgdA/CDA1 family)